MIERIYIPTVRRADNQITFNNLPKVFQERVVMVVEPGERHLYNYPCEYLEIPEDIVGSWNQLAQTRLFIHKHAGSTKYCMVDDDIKIKRRNAKYWTNISNMEKSKRDATDEDLLECFDSMSQWLDESDIGVTGFTSSGMFPSDTPYKETYGVYSIAFIDGRKLSKIIDKIEIAPEGLRISEDVLFIFECLANGLNTRVSNEWLYYNTSCLTKELDGTRVIWEGMYGDEEQPDDFDLTDENYDALKFIQKRYPHGISFSERNGKRSNTKKWKSVYRPKTESSLESFF